MDRDRADLFVKIAHRGASAYEPENTIRSFERAIEMKTDMIEFDVRRSMDQELVVIHDKTVDRTTSGKGLVASKTLEELKTLDAGLGEKIPSFNEAIECIKNKSMYVIELKEDGIEEDIVKTIRDHKVTEDCFIVSFKPRRLKLIKEYEPGLRTGLICLTSYNAVVQALEYGVDAVAPLHWFITSSLVTKAHENDLYLLTWKVNSPTKAYRLKELGADGIVTDRPDI